MAKIQWNNYVLRDKDPNEIIRKINVNGKELELPNRDVVDLLDTDIPVTIIDNEDKLNIKGQFANKNNLGYTPVYTFIENKHDIKYYFRYDDELRNKYLYKEVVYDIYGNKVYEKIFKDDDDVLMIARYELVKSNIPFHKVLLTDDYILDSGKSYKEVVNMDELTKDGLKVSSMFLNNLRIVSNIQLPIDLDGKYLDFYIDTNDIGNGSIDLYVDNVKITTLNKTNSDDVITLDYDLTNKKLKLYKKHVLSDTIDIYTEPKDLRIIWVDDGVKENISYTIKWMDYYDKNKTI